MFCFFLFINTAAFSATNDEEQQVLIGFKDKANTSLIQKYGGKIKRTYKHIPVVAAKVKKTDLETLKLDPSINYIEPDYPVQATGEVVPWGVSSIEAPIVHLQTEGIGVKVAVIDTGIDYTHPDLAVAGGYSAISYTNSYYDDNGHGTHVAGTVAAADNDIGVIGVAPQVNLYAVKALDSVGSGYVSDIVEGIEWSISNGIKIINMSLGSSADSKTLHDACDRAYAGGILLVAAAGNSGTSDATQDNVSYPARYSSVIAVSATVSSNQRPSFSSTGPDIELAAPGFNIYSTLPGGLYGNESGTSMASPHVAGTAALVWAMNPTMTNEQVRQRLDATAIDLGTAGKDNQFGYGLVDAKNAVASVQDKVMLSSIKTDKSTYSFGETVYITVLATDSLGNSAAGSSVSMQIKTSNGKIYTKSLTTDVTGKVTTTFKPNRKDGKGTYSINTTISKIGYTSAQGNVLFNVY